MIIDLLNNSYRTTYWIKQVPDISVEYIMETDEHNVNGDMSSDEMSKVFNDPIHGHIELHPLCIKIIDTPQFQRLRNIKQLGTCYLVYPGASHNRFEHSLGVCHLAGKLLRAIKERQPDESISDKDILCVEIAGLCHDLGHGPFSHLFDQKFIPSVIPGSRWKHEKASVQMFEYMLQKDDGKLREEFKKLMDDFKEEDLTFIKELIDVPAILAGQVVWPYKGRGKDKSFLYEVVANKTNGIDVDKWDYFARDCYMLGMKNSFDHARCISSARVLVADGRKQICYREKEAHDLYDMFHTRMTLHRKAYQHKTHNIIGKMMCDALVAADEIIKFEGENGAQLKMSETIHDMEAYTKLTDTVLRTILLSSDERLEKSKDILNDIINRKLYKCVSQTQRKVTVNGHGIDTDKIKEFILEYKNENEMLKNVNEADLEIDVVKLDYGMKTNDPILNVRFYSKDDENKAITIKKSQISHFLPETFAEQYIRLYCKVNTQDVIEHVREAFSAWCSKNKYPKPKGEESDCDEQSDTETTGE
ncbi:deoxynucleoside triphosphate triphosphohydrolase SAMHD1-like [Mercenaria mercenaria]|uniref:deoxynucleoside triphosphate triphosphohydrolase SAMHD1-like n=1 Tax=Mercenaria mercenaria TaxID=6596 RepID=UPI00234F2A83|nr:deoxynucleoside triphosphate triphosphohydrolase SAMHD1-like [Mercenaria mercenaria]